MSGQESGWVEAARSAMERAHRAASDADGPSLRLSLEDARDCLAGAGEADGASSGDTSRAMAERLLALVREALSDLDRGALAHLEPLLEQARRELVQLDQ